MKRLLFVLILLFVVATPFKSKAFELSDEAEISVLTCGPSDLIHAIYGHTAVRVQDPQRLFDVVFNYGVFSFSQPNFVYRFAKGRTDYMLAPEKYADFYHGYKRNGRSIKAQVLNLTQKEKQQMLDFLIWNSKPENREYRYNFFYDNCATRVRDLVVNQIDANVAFQDEKGMGMTFREHANEYQKVLPWTNFGIHLTLGSPADKTASAYEEMFLPDYLMKHFAQAQIEQDGVSRPLVKETRIIYDSENENSTGFNLLSPVPVLSIALLLVLWISCSQYKTKKVNYLLDYVLLFVTGLMGLVALWLVTYSEHPAMHPNYNLWWAVPANLPFLFLWMVKKWRQSLKWYWKALAVWLILFCLFSFFIPQTFHVGFYLLTLMMLCRALLHSFLFLRAKRQV
ncbi:DUF4105 domain-containing protein [uncultured Sunxiuqinia sp.]|uniref:lipoprotein N-acyltransferase Lnb domain-containing protein n=1 Tax=uncultured Sunxiuqinia sp. TaxID=1573825 RepID=UPI002AA6AFD6|nr:DUF4105 domain-containing protein [uncultured Sunxiuqinia sp.]